MQLPARVYAEINLDAICQNVQNAMDKVGADVKVMAIVKADAYGHGAVQTAKALHEIGVYAFGVATVAEAVQLRRNGIENPILILGHVFPEDFQALIQNHIMHAVFEPETAKALSQQAVACGETVQIHIKIDTGMGRIGMQPTKESIAAIQQIAALPNLEIQGIFTHFACADETDKTSCTLQKQTFLAFCEALFAAGVDIPLRHMCNSAGIIDMQAPYLDMVRSGIMTYGLYPSAQVDHTRVLLTPAMQLKSRVAFVKTVEKGFTVSYGSTYVTSEKTVIATIPVGYGDGYPRALSNKGRVLIRGQYAEILGRVCMDQLMVNVTDIPGVCQGDVVTLVGTDGTQRISVEEVADAAGSFNYEFCCNINKRVPRVYLRNGKVTEIADALV